ncbi:MAG TPA: hypothetical protein VGC06_18635 [Actinomycetes bacterium]
MQQRRITRTARKRPVNKYETAPGHQTTARSLAGPPVDRRTPSGRLLPY